MSIDQFSYGLLTPVLAYAMSSVGSLLGLLLASRARLIGGRESRFWLAGAALAIGGTGIWTMHFIAMIGFAVEGAEIHYDVPLTAASALLAVAVVGAGLFLVFRRGEQGSRPIAGGEQGSRPIVRGEQGSRVAGDRQGSHLIAGGVLTGLGVAGMHYLGMTGMRLDGHISYDPVTVVLSVAIAIAAATAALWFSLRVRGALRTGGAALVMGAAVSGMHYTGMYAMAVEVHSGGTTVGGTEPIDFLVPLVVGVSVVTVGLLLAVLLSPSEREVRAEREFQDRMLGRERGAPETDLFGTPRG
ncbi:MHYT domain-containing protein [Nonomuraea sp. NPDC005501]|uniref:MHYT domain-containing protein n=1 Tax=Nonomuraea sp. NPDC005501 TaxID=3156884 RepID=UPI00339F182C